MSIHHEVTVHCDGCGHWEQGNPGGQASSKITRQRRREGWLIWQAGGQGGTWRHLCPNCAADPTIKARVYAEDGGPE